MFALQKRQYYCNPKPQEGDKIAEVGSPVPESSVATYWSLIKSQKYYRLTEWQAWRLRLYDSKTYL